MVSHRSHRRHAAPRGHGYSWPARIVALSAAAGAAAALSPASPADAKPGDGAGHPSRSSVGARVDRLYAEAERATQKYDGAVEQIGALHHQVEYAQDRAARGQARVNGLRAALGSVAGAQYRSGGIDPSVALLLTERPDSYLDKAAALERIGSRQAGRIVRLRRAERALAQQRAEAGDKLVRLERERRELKRQRQAVRGKLSAARRLLHHMSAHDRAAHERASRAGDRGGRLPGLGAHGQHASSARAGAAVAAARSAVGRPYVWGATGPGSFDCSGLTQWAYGRAGTAIPRTSQAQRTAGRQVPLSQARPGDLVVYREDASHVAMYVGDGRVVHAPHPGAAVRYDPVGMMPVSAVTRP